VIAERWEPIAPPQERRALLETATTLLSRFDGFVPERDDAALATGWAGVALFEAYRAAIHEDEQAIAAAGRTIERALEGIETLADDPSLFTGLAGISWVLAHLDGWLLDLEDEDPLESVDRDLEALVGSAPWTSHFDLVSGLAGLGVYAEERLPRPEAVRTLRAIADRLAERADPREHGAAWHTAPEWIYLDEIRADYPDGYYDLGVAHGHAGVVAALGKLSATDPDARFMLGEALDWLWGNELGEGPSAFSNYAFPSTASEPARAAWCYGDPGISVALLVAADASGDDALRERAIAIGARAAARPMSSCGVVDASVCHGAAGLAHLFHRLFVATGDGVFADASRRWLAEIPRYLPAIDRPWFLEGAAGVGLVLLAAATDQAPAWDRILLASHAEARAT